MSTAITKTGGGFTLAPQTWADLMEFAKLAATSDLVPKDYRGKPANIVLAVQWGGELGLAPLQALQSIAVINGRPSIWGDGMLALCQAHPDYEDTVETYDEKTGVATCVAKRKRRTDKTHTFGADDVKKAGLGATHNSYPKRMRQMRARGFALRDQWADVLKGFISREEAQDFPPEAVRAEVVEPPKPEPTPKTPPMEMIESVKTAADEGPRVPKTYPDGKIRDQPLSQLTGPQLLDLIAWLESIVKDDGRKRLHAKAKQSLTEAEDAYEALVAKDMDAAQSKGERDPIAEGLQKHIDDRDAGLRDGIDVDTNNDTNSDWGMEAAP